MVDAVIAPNFTISEVALAALADLRADMARDDPHDPPAVAMVGGGCSATRKTASGRRTSS
jgi:hypothetical protein